MENNLFAEFDSGVLFSYASAESGKSLCAHLKSEFSTCIYEQDFVTSQLILASCGPA